MFSSLLVKSVRVIADTFVKQFNLLCEMKKLLEDKSYIRFNVLHFLQINSDFLNGLYHKAFMIVA
jgi:hypothetical protein